MKNNLKKIRTGQKISASQLAKEIGVSERYITFLEAGSKNPSLKTAMKIARFLDEKIDNIFEDQNVL